MQSEFLLLMGCLYSVNKQIEKKLDDMFSELCSKILISKKYVYFEKISCKDIISPFKKYDIRKHILSYLDYKTDQSSLKSISKYWYTQFKNDEVDEREDFLQESTQKAFNFLYAIFSGDILKNILIETRHAKHFIFPPNTYIEDIKYVKTEEYKYQQNKYKLEILINILDHYSRTYSEENIEQLKSMIGFCPIDQPIEHVKTFLITKSIAQLSKYI